MGPLDLLFIIEIGAVFLVLLAISAVSDYLHARFPAWMRRRAAIKGLQEDFKRREGEIRL